MSRARDKANSTVSNFASTGIDDNADANAITIDSSEKVGIGETSPLGTVHIRSSDASITSVNANADDLIVESNGNTGMSICSSTSGEGNINFIDSGDTNIGRIQYTHSNNNMIFRANDAERMRLTSDGLTFNGDTAAANALDDYEEGTFTPAYTEGLTSVSYQFRGGKYTKVGRFVYFQLSIRASAATTNGNQVRISGLPFNSDTSASAYGGAFLTYNNNFYVQLGGPTLFIQENDTHVLFYKKSDGGTLKGNDSDLQELNDIHINGFYKTA